MHIYIFALLLALKHCLNWFFLDLQEIASRIYVSDSHLSIGNLYYIDVNCYRHETRPNSYIFLIFEIMELPLNFHYILNVINENAHDLW